MAYRIGSNVYAGMVTIVNRTKWSRLAGMALAAAMTVAACSSSASSAPSTAPVGVPSVGPTAAASLAAPTAAPETASPPPQASPSAAPAPTPTPAPTKPAATNTVSIVDFSFGPGKVTIKVGKSVTWTNHGRTHTVTADGGSFASGAISPGGTFSMTFKKAGTFAYHCAIHPSMVGEVVVTP